MKINKMETTFEHKNLVVNKYKELKTLVEKLFQSKIQAIIIFIFVSLHTHLVAHSQLKQIQMLLNGL